MPDGGGLWLQWERAILPWGGKKIFPSDIESLEADANRSLTFVRAVARRVGESADAKTTPHHVGG
jgi:hypothetical protein